MTHVDDVRHVRVFERESGDGFFEREPCARLPTVLTEDDTAAVRAAAHVIAGFTAIRAHLPAFRAAVLDQLRADGTTEEQAAEAWRYASELFGI